MRTITTFLLALPFFGPSTSLVSRGHGAQEPGGRNEDAKLLALLPKAKHSLLDGIHQAEAKAPEVAISAKFELEDSGALSLSVYTAEKGLRVDCEHNVLKEFSGDPTASAWKPETEVFKDVPHVARSAQQLTLVSLGSAGLADIVGKAAKDGGGTVFSITPIVEDHKARYVVLVSTASGVSTLRYDMASGAKAENPK
jgi:hypothetical protein